MPPKMKTPPPTSSSAVKPQKEFEHPQFSYLMEYVLDPIYTWLAAFYPPWITPNQITVVGITSTVLASLIYMSFVLYPNTNDIGGTGLALGSAGFDHSSDLRFTSLEQYSHFNSKRFNSKAANNFSSTLALPNVCYRNDKKSAPPLGAGAVVVIEDDHRWILALIGIMNILYMVCDNTDGKQARRYGMCSNVGEYLDHGMDSIVFPLSVFVLCSCLFERLNIALFVQCFLGLLNYMVHNVNYMTNIMIWGSRWVSVDEATLLFSAGPLLVALFDHMSERVLPFFGLRVVQVVLFVLVASQLETVVKFIKADRRCLTNFGFFAHIAGMFTIFCWASYHEGGASEQMKAVFGPIHAKLTPYADWDLATTSNPVSEFFVALIKIAAMFVRNLSCCFPALCAIAIAIITSIMAHIAVAAKTLYQPSESWTPVAIVVFGALTFGLHPPLAVLLMAVAHTFQIRANILALLSPAHAATVAELKGKK